MIVFTLRPRGGWGGPGGRSDWASGPACLWEAWPLSGSQDGTEYLYISSARRLHASPSSQCTRHQTYTDLYSLIQENNHSKFTKGSIMSFLFTWAEIMSWKDNWGEKERERVRKWFVSFIVINHQDQECVEWIYLWGNWINFVPFVLYKDSYSFQNIFIHLQFLHFYKTYF